MSNDLIQFNFENDLVELENLYPCSNIESIYINDNNNGNYSNGKVNFTSASIVGSVSDKQSLWSQAQLIIPYTVTLEAIGCTFSTSTAATISQENSLALGTKGYHNFVDNFTCKFNGIPLNRNTNYVNMLMNEKLKTMGYDEKLLIGDLLNHELDNENSINYISTFGEVNNIIKPVTDYKLGLSDEIFSNQAHLKRMSNTNYNLNSANSNYSKFFGVSELTNSLSPYMEINTPAKLLFKGVAIIPLYLLQDAFKNMPSVASSTNFELNLQLNIASSNSWTITYEGLAADGSITAGGIHTLTSITSVQSVGNTCPFLVSQAGVEAGTGLSIRPTNALKNGNFSVKMSSKVGWSDGTNNNNQPCRIYLPTVQLNPSYTNMILSQPSFKLLYNDFYQDTILNIKGGETASKAFNVNISRPRTLYIIPFLSNQNAITGGFMTSPYLSPCASAPNTTSPCSLSNFQVQIGGQPIFSEPLQYNYNFYNDHVMSLIGKHNGNAIKSDKFSGQITKSMWEKGYGVYMINLEKVSDQIQDDISKSFQIQFRVNTLNTVKYDFIVLLEYQIERYINRTTGRLSDSPN